MNSRMTVFAAWLPAFLLAACAGNPALDESASIERPASQQYSGSDSQRRAQVHTELGKLYLQEGRPEIALEQADKALAVDGSYAPAYNLLGLTYMFLGKNELAEQNFRQALRHASNDPEINNDYGWFLCRTGKPRESLPYFKVAIANPLFHAPVKALLNAGVCSIKIKDDRQAEDYLLRALRIERNSAGALYWLADIAYRENRLADAQQRVRELHNAMEPTAETAWLALRIARKLGDREEEARLMGLMRRKFRDSLEYQKLSRGEFD